MKQLFLIFLSVFYIQNTLPAFAFKGSFTKIKEINGYKLSLIQHAQSFNDTIIFLNDNGIKPGPFTDICFYDGKNLRVYDSAAMSLPDSIQAISMWCAAKDSTNNYYFGSDLGIIKFNGKKFDYFSPYGLYYEYGNNTYSVVEYRGDIYLRGHWIYLLKFDGEKFSFLKGNKEDGSDSLDWTVPFGYHSIEILDNKLYFFKASHKIAYYDLENEKFNLTNFDSLPQISFPYGVLDMKKIDNKLYFTMQGYNADKSFLGIYDGNSFVIDSSYKEKIVPNAQKCFLNAIFKDGYGNWIYSINNEDGWNSYLWDPNSTESIKLDIGLNDKGNGMTLNNVMTMSDGKVYYALLGGGFLVYDPNGTGVEETEELSSVLFYGAYPNPTTDIITVKFATPPQKIDELKIDIYTYIGTKIKSAIPQQIEQNPYTGTGFMKLDLSDILPGNYYMVIHNNKDSRMVPVIKE